LRRQAARLEELSTRVVTISFGRVDAWPEDTPASFELLLDRGRTAYAAYGVLSPLRAATATTAAPRRRRLLKADGAAWKVPTDLVELGGDFIVDNSGVVRFAHRGDEPPVDELLAVLAALATGAA
jgi:hypothetical protein